MDDVFIITISHDREDRLLDKRHVRSAIIKKLGEVDESVEKYGPNLCGINVKVESGDFA